MINLKDETLAKLEEEYLLLTSVDYVANGDVKFSLDKFLKLADFEYDNGYGQAEINLDLEIVFKDGSRLERMEYDGSECYRYLNFDIDKPWKELPTKKDIIDVHFNRQTN